jgi:TonB-linked SusC/RagA family outer membrane protein
MRKLFTNLSGAVLVFILFINASFAQQNIKGKITDATSGETLIGVSVLVKGTTTGTQTDVNGTFSITAPANSTLVFTYVGYTTQQVVVTDQTTINIKLAAEAKQLAQVVVVGYGTQRRRDVTGAVASVSGEDLARQPVQTPTQALQGKVAGVQIISSGQPNSQPQVRVRGTGSVLAGAEPLYVVDGVLTDDIRNINNADIVSVDVLKDASAAIYGVRGANGVIIITTRKGKNGPPVVRYHANAGFSQIANKVKMANRDQYISYLTDADPTKVSSVNLPGLTAPGTTDWYGAVLRNAFQMNHNISVSGGSDKSDYFISANYLTNNGIIQTNNFQRFTLRENTSVNITDKLKLSSQLSLTRGAERAVPLGDTYNSIYRAAPVIPAEDANGKYGNTSAWGNVGNPLLQIDKTNTLNIGNRVQGNLALDYNPLKFLKLHTAFNDDVFFNNNRTYLNQYNADASTFTIAGGNQRQANSSLSVEQNNSFHYVWDNTATYDQTYGQSHVTVLGGYSVEKFRSSFINGSRINVPASPDEWYLNVGDPNLNTSTANSGDLYTRQSFFARGNYSYGGKYLLSGTFRRDGSSRFSTRYGNFYTVGAGWVISEESFMKNQKLFSNLKLRASYGELGNDNIGTGLYIVTAATNLPYYFNGNNLVNGSVIQDIKDTNLKWETTKQLDLGIEYGFLNNRLTGEADYYNKKVANALTYVTLPGIFGDPDNLFVTNAASYKNEGVEVSLNWSDKVGSKFKYSVGANLSYNKNTVIGLNGGQALQGGGVGGQGYVTRTDNGQPIASFYILQATGVFQNQAQVNAAPTNTYEANKVGGLMYKDINNDGKIDANDRQYSGSYQPKYYGGFNVSMSYAAFDLNADFYGNWGNKIYNGKKAFRSSPEDNVEAAYVNNRWTPSNPSNTNPNIITQSTPASTYFLESGAFLRLNNLTLGYTVPSELLKRAKISRLRIFATSQNLFTAKRYSGFSPELQGLGDNTANVLGAGIELGTYPTVRTFSFGVNLQF